MIDKISRFLMGNLKIQVSGKKKSQFINLAIKNEITFWNYDVKDENYIVNMRSFEYKKCMEFKKTCNVNIEILERNGLPFMLQKLRLGFYIGLILSVVLYCFLFSKCWIVNVNSSGFYSKDEILQAVEELGIYVGSDKFQGTTYNINNALIQKFPNINWVSVNNYGCVAEIELNYVKIAPEVYKETGVGHMVSDSVGVVKSVEVLEGMPNVQIGAVVEKGDVLITGIWDSNRGKNEWEQIEDPFIYEKCARGTVLAEVYRKFTVEIPKTKNIYKNLNSYTKYEFNFFGISIPFTPSLVPNGEYKFEKENQSLYILDKEMPISVTRNILTKQEVSTKTYSENEIKTLVEKALVSKAEESLGEKEEIISIENIEIIERKNCFFGELCCKTLENIAVLHKISE